MIIAGNELTSLMEAQNSPEWPEWQQAMAEELELLEQMGTWKLVPKPPNTIPIANKWVFIKKCNNNREEICKRAWPVVKGCAQHPGYDYLETYSPVVRIDTLCIILALVPLKNLQLQQIDIKGAYLNGILQETIYMHQLEECEDGTHQVCLLIKTLYGLKQAGCEWNH